MIDLLVNQASNRCFSKCIDEMPPASYAGLLADDPVENATSIGEVIADSKLLWKLENAQQDAAIHELLDDVTRDLFDVPTRMALTCFQQAGYDLDCSAALRTLATCVGIGPANEDSIEETHCHVKDCKCLNFRFLSFQVLNCTHLCLGASQERPGASRPCLTQVQPSRGLDFASSYNTRPGHQETVKAWEEQPYHEGEGGNSFWRD